MSKTVELARHLETLHINNMYKNDFYWTWDKPDEEIAAVIAVAGGGKRELLDRRIGRELEELMSTRGQYAADSCTLPVVDTDERYAVAVAAPILSEGDVLGCVLFVAAHGDGPAGETERKLAQAVSGFLGKQMES